LLKYPPTARQLAYIKENSSEIPVNNNISWKLTKRLLPALLCLLALAPFSNAEEKGGMYIRQWISADKPEPNDFQNRVIIIEFWATWCPPCVQSVPHLKKLVSQYDDKNVLFLALSQDQIAQPVIDFYKKHDLNYFVALDGGTGDQLGIDAIPVALVIGHDGKIVWAGNPLNPAFDNAIEKAVAAAPESILSGISLGKFRSLRFALAGSKEFSQAFGQLTSEAAKKDSPDAKTASAIVDQLETRLKKRISDAQALHDTDPAKAISLYKSLQENFCCIKLTEQIPARIEELTKKTVTINK